MKIRILLNIWTLGMYGTLKPKELLEHVEHFEFCKLMDPFETMYVEVTARDREEGGLRFLQEIR